MATPQQISQLPQWATTITTTIASAIVVWFGIEVIDLKEKVTVLSGQMNHVQEFVTQIEDNEKKLYNHDMRIDRIEREFERDIRRGAGSGAGLLGP